MAAEHPGGRAGLIITVDPATRTRATTATKAKATIPGSNCGTWPRSDATCTSPISAGPPPSATSTTTPRTKRADGPAVQHRPEVPSRSPAQAAPQVEGRPASGWDLPLGHPIRPHLRHRTHPVPDLEGPRREGRPHVEASGLKPEHVRVLRGGGPGLRDHLRRIPPYQQPAQTTAVNRFGFREVQWLGSARSAAQRRHSQVRDGWRRARCRTGHRRRILVRRRSHPEGPAPASTVTGHRPSALRGGLRVHREELPSGQQTVADVRARRVLSASIGMPTARGPGPRRPEQPHRRGARRRAGRPAGTWPGIGRSPSCDGGQIIRNARPATSFSGIVPMAGNRRTCARASRRRWPGCRP